MAASRAARLIEFLERLSAAPAATSDEMAYELISRTLNEVEDEMSGTPFNPDTWLSDGRLYPPQHDSQRTVASHPFVKRFRSRAHNTYVAANGAIEIRDLSNTVLLQKAGSDGRHVWEL